MIDVRMNLGRTRSTGLAAVEFAIVLPLLLLLSLMVTDFARAIQTQIILVNISREGASLVARSSTYTEQQAMNALASTAPPLNMSANGMIYITRVMGDLKDGAVRSVVVGQSRWANGYAVSGYLPSSAIWNCGTGGTHWASDGSCTSIPGGTSAPTVPLMEHLLADGQTIYAVEVFYRFDMLFGSIDLGAGIKTPQIGRDMYAMSVM